MIPPPQQASRSEDEHRPLLAHPTEQDTVPRSWFYRARRAPVAVACVVAMALFTDMVVYGVVVPLLPKIVKTRLGGGSAQIGLLFSCYAIGLLGSTPIFAILSDKYQNRRIPMMFGMIGLAVATVCFARADNYYMLILARIGQGSAGGASWTIGLGMLADVYEPERLGVVMGFSLTANALGFLAGPLIGGYFYDYHGFAAPFIVCAALAVLDFLCIAFVAEPEKKKFVKPVAGETLQESSFEQAEAAVVESLLVHEGEGATAATTTTSSQYGAIKSSSESSKSSSTSTKGDPTGDVSMFVIASDFTIFCCLMATFVTASVFSGLEPILPLHLEELLGASATQTGLIFMAVVFPTLFASGIGYISDQIGRLIVSFIGMGIFALATVSLSAPSSFMGFVLPLMLFGLGSSVVFTPLLPAMADIVNSKGWNAYAKVYACYNMVYSTGMMAGPILAGFLYDDVGFRWTMIIFGLIVGISGPIIFGGEFFKMVGRVRARWAGLTTDQEPTSRSASEETA